jgi:hypothetical protein
VRIFLVVGRTILDLQLFRNYSFSFGEVGMKWFCVAVLVMFVTASDMWGQLSEPCAGPTSCGTCDDAQWSEKIGPFYVESPFDNKTMACPWYVQVRVLLCPDGTKVICSFLAGPVRDTTEKGLPKLGNADCDSIFNKNLDSDTVRILQNRAYIQYLKSDFAKMYHGLPSSEKSKYECPNGNTKVEAVAASCAWGAPFEGEILVTPIDKVVGDVIVNKGDKVSMAWRGVVWVDCASQHCCRRYTKICWDKERGEAKISETLYTPDDDNSCGNPVNTKYNPPNSNLLPPGCRYSYTGRDEFRCKPNCFYILEEYK